MAILRGGGAGGRELQAPDGLDLAGPARDERRCVVVEVRAEIRAALRGGDRVEARTSRPHHRSPLTRPSRRISMRGNPSGSLSSAGRFATGLLSFRYTVWTCLIGHSQPCLGGLEDKVAAGVNPAANA